MKKINWKNCIIVGVLSGILSFLLSTFLHMDSTMAGVLSLLLFTCLVEIIPSKKKSNKNIDKTENGAM